MAKFELVAKPKFQSKVAFPQAGGEPVEVLLTFRHRTKSALDEFIKTREGASDVDSFMGMVEGWELTDEFNRGNVELLLENCIGAALATYETYITELTKHRRGN